MLRWGVTWCGPLLRVIRRHHPGHGTDAVRDVGGGSWELGDVEDLRRFECFQK